MPDAGTLAANAQAPELERVEPRIHVELHINGRLMMSDARMEQLTNAEFVERAHGDVLVAGLGLGMVLFPVLVKPAVQSVTVIERNADVIALVEPAVRHPKLTVIHGDIFQWAPEGKVFQTIYFDIWPTRGASQQAGIDRLHERFAACLDDADPGRWMGSWYHRELAEEQRELDRRERRWLALLERPEAEQREALWSMYLQDRMAEARQKGFTGRELERYRRLVEENEAGPHVEKALANLRRQRQIQNTLRDLDGRASSEGADRTYGK